MTTGQVPRRAYALAVVALLAIAALSRAALALPPGRSWAATLDLAYPRLVDFESARLETDSSGVPLLIGATRWDTTATHEWSVFTWGDSSWSPRLLSGIPATYFPEPAISLRPTTQYLVWIAFPRVDFPPLLFAEIFPQPSVPETTMVTLDQSSEYGGAVSQRRRWVVRSQQRFPSFPVNFTFAIRTVYSDTVGIWRELPQLGVDEFMCTIAPLSDYSAMVVYGTRVGLRWARVEGNQWTAEGVVDHRGGLHPRLRLRPSGGLWLAWSSSGRRQMYMATYRDGVWSVEDSTSCVHAPGETYAPAWLDVSRDGAERPVVAWGDLGYGYTYRDAGCVAFPTDSGWTAGEEIPGSENLFTTPTVARDRNGDVWLAWRLLRNAVVRFTHTYVSATASAPQVMGQGRQRVVSWTLSEPAPDSWWAVLRARKHGPFEEVARVRAGPVPEMSWSDDSPPPGVQRYRIRRESVDARYRWESEEARWPPKRERPLVLKLPMMPVGARSVIEFAVEGAEPGSLEIRLYDLQGRRVAVARALALGGEWDTVRLDLGTASPGPAAGVYFLQVRDGAGQASEAVKVLLLR